MAKSWLNDAKFDERRFDRACIQHEAYEQSLIAAAQAQETIRAVEARQEFLSIAASPTAVDVEESRAGRLQTMLDDGELSRVERLIEAHPEWRLGVEDRRVVQVAGSLRLNSFRHVGNRHDRPGGFAVDCRL